ncbi:MAG: hypothetical protein RJA76_1726 [Bacteroidota bacterium]|jgi:hypothetical protein
MTLFKINSIVRSIKENYFSSIYLFIGFLSLYFFTWTGKYLLNTYPDKPSIEIGLRVMLRSRHIFILLISLVELGIGAYIQQCQTRTFLIIQWLAFICIFLSHILLIYAFFFEVELTHIPNTPALHYATYILLAGIILHVLTKFESKE